MTTQTIAERIEGKLAEIAGGQEVDALGWAVHVHEKNPGGGGVGQRVEVLDASEFGEDRLYSRLRPGTYWLRLMVEGRLADNIPFIVRDRGTPTPPPFQMQPTPPASFSGAPIQTQSFDLATVMGMMFQSQQQQMAKMQEMFMTMMLDRQKDPGEFERTLKLARMLNGAKGGRRPDDDDDGDMGGMVRELVAAFPAMARHFKQPPPPPPARRPVAPREIVDPAPEPLQPAEPDPIALVRFYLASCYQRGQSIEAVAETLADQLNMIGVPLGDLVLAAKGEPVGALLNIITPGGVPGVPEAWLMAVEGELRETVLDELQEDDDGERTDSEAGEAGGDGDGDRADAEDRGGGGDGVRGEVAGGGGGADRDGDRGHPSPRRGGRNRVPDRERERSGPDAGGGAGGPGVE